LGQQQADTTRTRGSDAEAQAVSQDVAEPLTAAAGGADRLGLDAFDEDLDVRPVVLLSRKRHSADHKADGAFMSDLERRLEADAAPSTVTDKGQTKP
jgi:hypothetical protein